MNDLTHLGYQLLRLATNGVAAVERAAAEVVTPAEAFDWLVQGAGLHNQAVRAAAARRLAPILGTRPDAPPEEGPAFRLYEGTTAPLYEGPYLPLAADRDFASYVARVAPRTQGREFGFQVPDLQAVNWAAFRRLLGAIGPLIQQLGPRKARFNCFFGNYTRTPFGAHMDAHHQHVFQYVIAGRRTLKVWDSAVVRRRLGADFLLDFDRNPFEHQHRLPRTTSLRAKPGDVLAWPGAHIHCVETDGPSIGLSIVIETADRHAPPRTAEEEVAFVSGRMCVAVPALLDGVKFTSSDALRSRLTPTFPVRLAQEGPALFIGAHGRTATWTDRASQARVIALVQHLNRAGVVEVGELVHHFATPKFTRRDVMKLLQFFVSAGAFDVEPKAR